MSRTTGERTDGGLDADSVASTLDAAGFVRIVVRATGDAVAAAGLLGRALEAVGTPFHVSVGRTTADRSARLANASADVSIVVGGVDDPDEATAASADGEETDGTEIDGTETDGIQTDGIQTDGIQTDGSTAGQIDDATVVDLDDGDEPASVVAWRIAGGLGVPADSVLALVGVAAAGVTPGAGSSARLVESADASGRLDRRPGIAGPIDDVVDALAYSTLVHASFSGDTDAAIDAVDALDVTDDEGALDDSETERALDDPETERALDEPDDDVRRRVASFAAVAATGSDDAPPAAGDAVERVLRPYVVTDDGVPFATIAGYADVLDALAASAPGTAIALALGHDVTASALDAWREHARAVHAAVRECDRARHDGVLCVHDVDAPLATTARLVRDYRSPEPLVAAFDSRGDAVALAGTADVSVADAVSRATTQTGGEYDATASRGYATIDCDTETFVTALREAVRA